MHQRLGSSLHTQLWVCLWPLGNAGSQTNKKTGNLGNTKTIERVRGAFYNILVVISEVLRKTVKLFQLKTPLSDHKHLLNLTKKSHMSFQNFPSNITLESYAQTMMFPPITLPKNVTINTTGIDTMDHMLGMFPFGK